MNLFKLRMKKKFLRGISWTLFLVLISTNTVFGTNSLTAYAQEVSGNSAVAGESQDSLTGESAENIVNGVTDAGIIGGDTDSGEDITGESIEKSTGLNETDSETVLGTFGANAVLLGDLDGRVTPQEVDFLTFSAAIQQKFDDVYKDIEGTSIDPIDSERDLYIKVSFNLPVINDFPTPTDYVIKGDWADFEVSSGFGLVLNTPITLKVKDTDIKVGVLTFTENEVENNGGKTYKVKAHIEFNGDVFDDNNSTLNNIICSFDAQLKYTGNIADNDGIVESASILQKSVDVYTPAPPITYSVEKSGVLNLAEKKVNWTVVVDAQQMGSTSISLGGFKFEDEVNNSSTNLGKYISGTFDVDNDLDVGNNLLGTLTGSDNKISYVFSDSAIAPQTITFSTDIPESLYYGAPGEKNITNTAKLYEKEIDTTPVTTGNNNANPVKFTTPKWISKSGEQTNGSTTGSTTQDPDNRQITWTIEANEIGASLNTFQIIDSLPAGLKFISATVEKWDKDTGSYNIPSAINPTDSDSVYSMGNISSKVRLTIVSEVNTGETIVTEEKKFTNSASIKWDNSANPSYPAYPADISKAVGLNKSSNEVVVGYDAITKTGTKIDTKTRIATWKIKVESRGQSSLDDLVVYDLLVYGDSGSGFDINDVSLSGFPAGVDRGEISVQYNQKYNGVFEDLEHTGIAVTSVPIIKNGEIVADLLVFDNFSDGLSEDSNEFSFETLILNPNIYANNGTGGTGETKIYNTADLFSGTTYIDESGDDLSYTSNILRKEMIKNGNTTLISDPLDIAKANNRTTNAAEGFNYIDKSVIYRLVVNADGINWPSATNGSLTPLGNVTVTDTLPVNWNFIKFKNEKDFLIFEADSSGNAIGTVLDSVSGLSPNVLGDTATFTFSSLDRAYVILVKAKPSDDTIQGYFSSNKKTENIKNNVNFKTASWTPGVSTSVNLSVESKILYKDKIVPENGVLRWTVEYKPYGLEVGTKIVDTLSEGIDLRTDSKGELLLKDSYNNDNIKAIELILNADGTYSDGGAVILTTGTGGNISYNNANRQLTFIIPDKTKAYRLIYLTDLTGDDGTKVKNLVSLYDSAPKYNLAAVDYDISSLDGIATAQRNGYIDILKKDGSSPLAGAEFTLFAEDNVTVIRKGVSDSNGKIRLKVIPDGNYFLRETIAPTKAPDGSTATYALEGIIHKVTVKTEGLSVTTTIDGKTGVLEAQNYPLNEVGDLTLTKTIAGNANEVDKDFEFKIVLDNPNTSLNGKSFSYTINGVVASDKITGDSIGSTILLKHGDILFIPNLLKDTNYTITETDYSSESYSTHNNKGIGRIATGTIKEQESQDVIFTNTKYKPGSLVISKTVMGNGGETGKEFDFTIVLSDKDNEYTFTGINGGPSGKIKGEKIISLKDRESVTIADLPSATTYTVTEADYSAQGYITEYSDDKNGKTSVVELSDTGQIPTDEGVSVSYVNTKNVGNLSISKTVDGNGGDKGKEFEFTVTFSDNKTYSYKGTGVSDGTIKSGDKIKLADGQSIEITGILEGTTYTVKETDYSSEGYTMKSTGETGTISKNTVSAAQFTNTKNVGSLSISKTVDGNAGDKNKEFEFTVTFSDNKTYSYKGTGVSDGTIKSGDIIKLADGQSIEITGILEGTAYTVKEEDYSPEGYVTKFTGETGTISKDTAGAAHFTNTKNNGNLAISKSVEGNRGDKNKKFEFTVTFNTNKTYSYIGTGVDDGTITSGDVIELADGQSIEITGILEGTTYTVEETDYSSEGYMKRSVGETGTISKDTASVAHFINTYEVDESSGRSKDPDDTSSYMSKLIAKYRMGEVPNPNGKDAPDKIILVDKDGNVLGTYTRVQNADGTYSYVDENGVALSASSIAKTGDNMPLIPIIVVTLIAVVGAVVLFLYKRKIFGYYYDS